MEKHNEYLNERLQSLENLLECTNKQIEFTKKSKYEVNVLNKAKTKKKKNIYIYIYITIINIIVLLI